MADYPEDLAKGIAENIGVMPLVTKAGEAGSGFMNFLSSLLPGGTASAAAGGGGSPPPAAPSQKGGGYLSFLSSLFQPTVDAFQQDVDAVREGRLPPEALKTAEQAMGAMGSPSINPRVGAQVFTRFKQGPPGEGQFLMPVKQTLYPGGDWATIFGRQGGFGEIVEQLLKGLDPIRTRKYRPPE